MTITREQVMAALFAAISPGFVTVGRRLRDPEGLDPTETPALFLLEHEDEIDRKQGFNIRAKRSLMVKAFIYVDVGANQNAIPASLINNLIDQIETTLTPPPGPTNTVTLGGLALSVNIDGNIERASGDVTGKALAVVPIRVLIP